MDVEQKKPTVPAKHSSQVDFGRESYAAMKGDMNMSTEHLDEDGHLMRTGTVLTGASHIITAVIGAGVLSLAWATAQVGWIAGPIMIVMFSAITIYCANMLSRCYRYPGPYEGDRNYTYTLAVRRFLGWKYVAFCGIVQHLNLVATSVGYTVTSGLAMSAIHRDKCYHDNPDIRAIAAGFVDGEDTCQQPLWKYMVIFGAIQIVFIQIPDMDRVWWLSVVSAVCSFVYSFIGVGLCIARVVSKRGKPDQDWGTIDGVPMDSSEDGYTPAFKTWYFFLALSNVAFAYSFNFILIEICDTLKGPKEGQKLIKATWISLFVTSGFYMSIGTIGYAAFGNSAPGNLLTGFGFFEPYWLVIIANLGIIIHLFGGYQVWTQPFLMMVESTVDKFAPNSAICKAHIAIPMPGRPLRLYYWVIVWRTLYVCAATVVAAAIPLFNDIVGIMGSLGFWPLTIFLPIEMYIVQAKIPRWSAHWIWLQSLSLFCFCISAVSMVGSIIILREDLKTYTPFS